MSALTELPSNAKSPDFRADIAHIIDKLFEKAINSPVGGIIFSCNLHAKVGALKSLCDKADPDAIKIVDTEAQTAMPKLYAWPFASIHADAIDVGIGNAIDKGNIVEKDGHAVATPSGRLFLANE